jgi:hypothetical protein
MICTKQDIDQVIECLRGVLRLVFVQFDYSVIILLTEKWMDFIGIPT